MAAVRALALPYLVTRAAAVAAAVMAAAAIPHGVDCSPCELSASPLLSALARWDGGAYLSIARDGYSYVPDVRSNVAFSPLLPILMRLAAGAVGRSDDDALIAAGLLVSNAALLVAVALLLVLARREVGDAAGRRAVLYFLVFPTTIFLSALYPSSLFIALALGTLVEARRGRWLPAGALAALGALARPFGVVLAIPLLVQAAVDRGATRARWATAVAVALPIAASLAWQAYLYTLSGDPLLFLRAQQAYGRSPSVPLREISDLLDPRIYGDPWIVGGVFIVVTALTAASWRVLHPATAACGTAVYLAALSSGTLTSFPRYALTIFPAFLTLGVVGARSAVSVPYLVVASLLAILLSAMFGAWYWIG